MVLNEIEKLLEKYDNGETSIKEEAQLRQYFSQETVAPHLKMYKPMFGYFLANEQEAFTKELPLDSLDNKVNSKFNFKWLSVAAVVLVLLGFYLNESSISQEELGTFSEDEKQLALNEIKHSLNLVSNVFNKGAVQVSYLEQLNNAGTQFEYLNDMNNPLERIFNKHSNN